MQDKDIVATVNDVPIHTSEFQKEVAQYAKKNPAQKITRNTVDDRLHTLIERKLLIQEAVKKGINEDERFVKTIKTFWEQTIIRELIDAKNREWSEKLFVTNDEIRKEYDRMRYRPQIRAARADTKKAAEEIAQTMRDGKLPPGTETMGPLFYDDVKFSPLSNAFDMEVGEIKAFAADNKYIVIGIINKETIPLPPLKSIYDQIRESLLAQKKQKALTAWIEAVKQSSKVQINDKALREIAHE